jgi:hypothetical protein
MKHRYTPRSSSATNADVTVSELAAFSYCAKAWHLERVLHVTPLSEAAKARAVGIDQHYRHGMAARRASWLSRYSTAIVWVLALGALLCALFAALVAQ